MPLIVEYEARTLRERLVADFTVFMDEQAFELRLVEVQAFNWNPDLLVSAVGKHFEPSVIRSARDGRLFSRDRYRRLSASLASSPSLRSRKSLRCRHGLHRCRTISLQNDLYALDSAHAGGAWSLLLLLNIECKGLLLSAGGGVIIDQL